MSKNLESEIDAFLNYLLNVKRYSQHSIRAYQNDLGGFLQFVTTTGDNLSIETWESVTRKLVRSWVVDLHRNKIAPSTVPGRLPHLLPILRNSGFNGC